MIKNYMMTGLMLMTVVPQAFAGNKVVYDEDNRMNVGKHPNKNLQVLARSTAIQIKQHKIESVYDGILYKISAQTMEDKKLCKDEVFSQQLAAGNCSGFLVGKDLLVTAGHCMRSEYDCSSMKWVFDYRADMQVSGLSEAYVVSENVYNCKEIVSQVLSSRSKNDFALIKLDREVTDREPLKYRTEGKISDDAELAVMGYPSGLPLIIADGAIVRKNDHPFFFVTNLDTFGGNSGSPVVDATTGIVEGILVRGETDYTWDEENKCQRPFKCKGDECRGEDVTRITVIPELVDASMVPSEDDAPEPPRRPRSPFDFDFEIDWDDIEPGDLYTPISNFNKVLK